MIDKITYLETDSEKFPLAFTLNIMEALQDEYERFRSGQSLSETKRNRTLKL